MERIVGLLALATFALEVDAAVAQTLKTIKERGLLNCGVSQGIYGFSAVDAGGSWAGFDVDFCRAIAAAIFNDAGMVKFVPLSAAQRFASLQSGEIDLLSRNSTWTISRETELGLSFAAVTYYDGQGFLVRNARNVMSALELEGAKVCVQEGTTSELNLADFFDANTMTYQPVKLASIGDARNAYDSDMCDALTSDVSQLYSERLKLANPEDHVVLPDVISKEPLGPVVRQGDYQWFNIVKWTHFAMINAEELGVSSKTIEEAVKSKNPDIRRLVGSEGNYGEQLGLTRDWVVRTVTLVGNYGEVFERNLGADSRLTIPRGLNQLWSKNGIQYAPPMR